MATKKTDAMSQYKSAWDDIKAQRQPWRNALNQYQQAYTQMKAQGMMPSPNTASPMQTEASQPKVERATPQKARVKTVQKLNEAPATETPVTETPVTETPVTETVVEEKVETPTSETTTETKVERPSANFNSYASLSAPNTLKNDQMSGYRTWLDNINKYYGGDILGVDPSTLSVEDRKKYYEDYGLFNTIYSAVANYDAEALAEQKRAKEAEEYARTRRMLMERYLPETLAAMGYANTGLAADALTGINASYDNYALNARETAAENTNAAMSRYQQAIADYQAGQVANKQAEDTALTQAQETEYKNFKTGILDDPTFDTKQLDTALELGNITKDQYKDLISLYDTKMAEDSPVPTDENGAMQTITITKALDQSGIDMADKTVEFIEGGWESQGLDKEGLTADELATYSQSILARHNDMDAESLKEVLDIVSAGKKIPNGTIFDINEGKGKDLIVYWNGRFYPVKEVE